MKIDLWADITPFAASSWIAEQVSIGLIRAGADVVTVPIDYNGDEQALLRRRKTLVATKGKARKDVLRVLVKPVEWLEPQITKNAIVVTMWETDTLLSRHVAALNVAKAVLVASQWQKTQFKKNGVTVPVYVANYGISDTFAPTMRQFPKQYAFLAAGRTVHGERKGIQTVIAAFLLAFPFEQDVVLQIKSQEDCPLPEIVSPRIQVIRSWLNEDRMAEWYHQGLAFVNASNGECWGLHMHEAMACGRPVIGPCWGGVTEYINEHNAYVLPHAVVPAIVRSDEHHGQKYKVTAGSWAHTSVDDIANAMRFVYENPVHAFLKGLEAAQSVAKFSLERMYKQHNQAILRYA